MPNLALDLDGDGPPLLLGQDVRVDLAEVRAEEAGGAVGTVVAVTEAKHIEVGGRLRLVWAAQRNRVELLRAEAMT